MTLRIALSTLVVVGAVAAAHAQPKAPEPKVTAPALVGATGVVKLTAPAGFVDDVVATDDTRIGYVIADASTKAELHVLTLASKQEQVVDLAPITLHPVAVRLVGARAFVVGQTEEGSQIAALVELLPAGKKPAGAAVYKLGPATHITVITRDGKPRVALHTATTTPAGTRHQVEIVALETGKRVAAGKPFEVDGKNVNKAQEFTVNHWADGMTRAYGLKGGEWNKQTDQRSPDTEASVDLVTGKLGDRKPIEDLFEQRKRFQALADANGQLDFVRMAWDNASIQLWRAGKPAKVELDQPLATYDPKSLLGVVNADGSAWLALKVDPVNPDAVARKKADVEYLDIFKVGTDGKATRKARVLATGMRYRFGVIGDRFWLLERSAGFDRGGRSLTLYAL